MSFLSIYHVRDPIEKISLQEDNILLAVIKFTLGSIMLIFLWVYYKHRVLILYTPQPSQ